MLLQHDCLDLCGPHAWCSECRTLTCQHTISLFADSLDLRAAIAALPIRPARHVPYVPRPEYEQTAVDRLWPIIVRLHAIGPWVLVKRCTWLGAN